MDQLTITQYTKSSSWTSGPLKPTLTFADLSDADVKSSVDAVLDLLPSMQEGEMIQVMIRKGGS